MVGASGVRSSLSTSKVVKAGAVAKPLNKNKSGRGSRRKADVSQILTARLRLEIAWRLLRHCSLLQRQQFIKRYGRQARYYEAHDATARETLHRKRNHQQDQQYGLCWLDSQYARISDF